MDLSTIAQKVDSLAYSDGDGGVTQEFYNDVQLVFQNGKAYHRKGTRPYDACTILSSLTDAAYAVLVRTYLEHI